MSRKTTRLKPINYNAGNIKWYQKQLLTEIREMNDEVRREIVNAIRDNPLAQDASLAMDANPVTLLKKLLDALARKWVDRFINKALPVSDELMDKTQSAVDRGLLAAARRESMTINMQWTDAMLEKREAIIAKNVSLIRSIPEKYFTEVEGMVYRAVARGGDRKMLADEIERNFGKRHEITRRRAEFIARDQTRKATSALSIARQQAAGIVEAEWVHGGGGNRPRHSHVKAGKEKRRFKLSEGCLIDGEYIYPGQKPNCGCTCRPVLPF
ncbi:phage minor head protein [Providencia alcalifaciens]|uniref:phage head morphogenesis protein n=1 Tax=Providencia alcalifaciens TaxID=126385 RepID=UPI000452DC6F|nr:phage minor head protein [Providencia alcalifaciens]EUD08323.1 protein F-like protein [Providencia alcalifaciens R90-1475]